MPPKKKVAAIVKVALNAGAATPAPPVGTALGPHGVNIMEFCKRYNAETEPMRGNVIPVEITIFEDRTFTFITKTPPAAVLIKQAAGIEKGSGEPHKVKVAKAKLDAEEANSTAQKELDEFIAISDKHANAAKGTIGTPTQKLATMAMASTQCRAIAGRE